MKKFLLLLVIGGAAFAGYYYGAKAGRGKYREINAAADKFWNDPKMKKARRAAARDVGTAVKSARKKVRKAMS